MRGPALCACRHAVCFTVYRTLLRLINRTIPSEVTSYQVRQLDDESLPWQLL